jgi:hypothetical protein
MPRKKTTRKNVKSEPTKRINYKELYERLQAEVDDVHRMLDAADCPPNCGTLNGRMVEFAKDWLRRVGATQQTHPSIAARKMLRAVDAPMWPL